MKPYKTSTDIIESVKRNISFPISQNTFSEEDILAFANEEMDISQVPNVLQFQENYFLFEEDIPLVSGKNKYPIPSRAIGMNVKAVFFKDSNNNLYEMTQINDDDSPYFQRNTGSETTAYSYYFKNTEIVISQGFQNTPSTGYLTIRYYLRPNKLVLNERAAVCTHFIKTITVNNTGLNAGDIVTINGVELEAGTDFAIGVNSIATATNLNTAIVNAGFIATNIVGASTTETITIRYKVLDMEISSDNDSSLSVQQTITLEFNSVPENIVDGIKIDFLETASGHRIYNYDIELDSGAVVGNKITFDFSDVPSDFRIGDYICEQHECIIPNIPDDLHISLIHRTCARVLASINDQIGLSSVQSKIGEIEAKQGTMIDNRGSGDPKKIVNRHSLLRYGKHGGRKGI
jgi:hypothetical protein